MIIYNKLRCQEWIADELIINSLLLFYKGNKIQDGYVYGR